MGTTAATFDVMAIYYYDDDTPDANVIRTEYVVTYDSRPIGYVYDSEQEAAAKCRELQA